MTIHISYSSVWYFAFKTFTFNINASNFLFLMLSAFSLLLVLTFLRPLLPSLPNVILGVPTVFFLVEHFQKNFNNEPSLHHVCPVHMRWLAMMPSNILKLWYNTLSYLFFQILYSPVFTSLQGPYILLSTFLSKIFSEFSSDFCSVLVSDTYVTIDFISVRYILILKFDNSVLELSDFVKPK